MQAGPAEVSHEPLLAVVAGAAVAGSLVYHQSTFGLATICSRRAELADSIMLVRLRCMVRCGETQTLLLSKVQTGFCPVAFCSYRFTFPFASMTIH